MTGQVHFIQADVGRLPLADKSVDAVIGSLPYAAARTYAIGADRHAEAWASWAADVTMECLRVTRGAVVWVVDDQVKGHRLRPGVALLQVELYRRGVIQERPLIWRSNKAPTRKGLWWSHAWEYVLAFKRIAAPLPYFDWMAMAKPTVYATAGAFRERNKGGVRKARLKAYAAPALANPRDVIYAKVGGGHMGHPLACENEAPFPESLVEQIIPVLVPVGGIVLDPVSGSGTTPCVASRMGRIGIGADLRMNQAELGRRRHETPWMSKARSAKLDKPEASLFGGAA